MAPNGQIGQPVAFGSLLIKLDMGYLSRGKATLTMESVDTTLLNFTP